MEDDQRSYEAALNDRDSQIRKMREECQGLMLELQMLLDTKQVLKATLLFFSGIWLCLLFPKQMAFKLIDLQYS